MDFDRTSITDVAREAGVSVTTVSHAFSGNRHVNAETVARIREVAERLAYQPSQAATSLKLGTARAIAILVPDLASHFYVELAVSVERVAHKRGYSLILCNSEFDDALEEDYLALIQRQAIDGLVYASGSAAGREILERAAPFPVALIAGGSNVSAPVIVGADHRGGGRSVGTHLRDLGHTRALVISAPTDYVSSDERAAGFAEAFQGSILTVEGDYRRDSGANAVAARHPKVYDYTAVFALNDMMALGAIGALRQMGLRVPSDVSVVGFDDIPTADLMNPALTTVHQPAATVGTYAADKLLDLLDKPETAAIDPMLVPVHLVVRESSGPVDESL